MQPLSMNPAEPCGPAGETSFPTEKPMRHKATALALVLTLLSIIVLPATLAQAQTGNPHPSGALTLPVSGTATDTSGAVNNVTGTLTINRFANQNGNLMALGTLVATVTNTATGAVQNIVTTVAVPVAIPSASCPILHLVLGPLDLTLLGLVVHLNQVVLDITAVPGAGNLLGNLLCAVANLLNGGGLSNALNQIVGLLNQILAAL